MILIQLVSTLVFSFFVASWTRFYVYLIGNPNKQEMDHGNIFSFAGRWMLRKYNHLEHVHEIRGNQSYRLNMYKALGICPYCNNVYWGILFGIIFILYSGFSWWLMVPLLGLSHFWLMKIYDWA